MSIGSFINPIVGLTVDFDGLPQEVFIGEEITLTASTPRDISVYDIVDELIGRAPYPASKQSIGDNRTFYYSKTGTQSVHFLQGDFSLKSNGMKIKSVLVSERVNQKYISVVGAANTGGNNFIKYEDFSNNFLWNKRLASGTNVFGTCFDNDGFIYTASTKAVGEFTVEKCSKDSDLIWGVDHGATTIGIAVDADGFVYICGNRTSDVTTRKYDSDGDLVWSVDHGATTRSIAVDSNGFVYTGGNRTSDVTTRKYDSNGNVIWSVDHGAIVRGVAVDNDGFVYTTGVRTSNVNTRKYDSDGNLIWSADHGTSSPSQLNSIAVDKDGFVYVGGGRTLNTPFFNTRKYDTDGNLIWSETHLGTVNSVAVDKDGFLYTASDFAGGASIRKYDVNANLITTVSYTTNAFGIATYPPNVGAFLS